MSEGLQYDIVIVGGGPAGLATAIRLRQAALAGSADLSVCVLEKAAEFGSHSLSGAVLDPRALDELLPSWRESNELKSVTVARDEFFYLRSEREAVRIPQWLVPPAMHNSGRLVVSLGALCRWLAEQAADLGVDLFAGFAGARLLEDEAGAVVGVATGDRGVAKSGERKPTYEPGIELRARHVVIAEGARGHLARQLIEKHDLAADCDPQHYALGLKEIWEIPAARHESGRVIHGIGWPLGSNAAGGFFCYHGAQRQIAIGLITDLNYANPRLSPFSEFQRLKQHPLFCDLLRSGRRIAYGARVIAKGGLNSLPRLSVPGATLVGCAAGTLDFSRIKGIHTAIKSGIVAADMIVGELGSAVAAKRELTSYRERLLAGWLGDDLRRARNVQAAMHRFGPLLGSAYVFLDQSLLRGRAPWSLHDRVPDHETLMRIDVAPEIVYAPPDGELSFDRLSSVYLSGTQHDDDQPSHLTLQDPALAIDWNLAQYDSPEQRYCPAGVYEIVAEHGVPRLQINAQNCLHCKACDVKDPRQNIVWLPPEEGGPQYSNM